MDAAALARTVQYLAVAVVGGGSLMLARRPEPAWPRWITVAAALAGAAGAFAWLALKAVEVADLSALPTLATETAVGRAAAARALILLAAAVLAAGTRAPWGWLAGLGAAASASFAWSGHGGGGGTLQLLSDGIHAVAAALWLGALPVLWLAALRRDGRAADALRDFSRLGPGVVGVLTATGLANVWLLAGPEQALRLPDSPYGRLLLAKLALFAGMLGLAAWNRWRLTPALRRGGSRRAALLSLSLETALGASVLALVGWLGTLPPPGHG